MLRNLKSLKLVFKGISFTLAILVSVSHLSAKDLTQSTFTQVVSKVIVYGPDGSNVRTAANNDLFSTPDVMETGPTSRAELVAEDQTVTRVGSNTIFSFQPSGRGIKLQQGSVLFNSPSGKGGGRIETRSATASVLGTTIIVSATRNGGFKMLVLEGKGKVTLPNGRNFELNAGQLTFILPGMTQQPPVFEFRLSKLLGNSKLLQGFKASLPSDDKLSHAEKLQEAKIAKGSTADTGLLLGDLIGGNQVEVIDTNTYQNIIEESVAANQFFQFAAEDAIINSPFLDPSRVVTFMPDQSLIDFALSTGGTTPINLTITDVFTANNLTIATPVIDLSPFNNSQTFVFFAFSDLLIGGDLNVLGYAGHIIFEALGQLTIANGSLLNFPAPGGVEFNADGALAPLNGVSINSGGPVSIYAFNGPVTMNNVNISGNGTGIMPGGGGPALDIFGDSINATNSNFSAMGFMGDAMFFAFNNITMNGVNVNAANHMDLFTVVGTIDLKNGTFNSGPGGMSVNAGNDLVVGGFAGVVNINAPGGVYLAAQNLIKLDGVTFNSFNITMSADTIAMGQNANVNFPGGSIVNFFTTTGQFTFPTGGPPTPGWVNFYNATTGVNYNGTRVTGANFSTINAGSQPFFFYVR